MKIYYSKKTIGEELIKELNKGYSIERISFWACDIFVNNQNEELDDILNRLTLIDAGPEFEYTDKELRLIAELLINEETDLIKKINQIKFDY